MIIIVMLFVSFYQGHSKLYYSNEPGRSRGMMLFIFKLVFSFIGLIFLCISEG